MSWLFGGSDTNNTAPLKSHSKARIINMWAHKGGVAKTTNVIHIAAHMARRGLRVVLVDADPQTSLTECLCEQANKQPTWRDNVERGNLVSAYKAAKEAANQGSQIPPAALVSPDCAASISKGDGGIFLLPGCLDTQIIDKQLTLVQALELRHILESVTGFEEIKVAMGVLRQMFLATAEAYNADFVLVDMGPSICEMNFNLLFSGDFFVVPANTDRMSKSALLTIVAVMQTWAGKHQKLLTVQQGNKCPLKKETPKFAGVIYGRIPGKMVKEEFKPVNVSAEWMHQCKSEVSRKMVPKFAEYNLVAKNIDFLKDDEYTLGEIPQFTKVHEVAMRCYHPVYAIPEDKVRDVDKNGNIVEVKGKAKDKLLADGKRYEEHFKFIVERLFKVIGYEEP